MARRTVALIAAGALVVMLAVVTALIPVPYAALVPGPATNVLGLQKDKPVISISGRQTYPPEGEFTLVTVAVTGVDYRMDLLTALQGWLDPRVAIVPKQAVYPGNKPKKQLERENAEQMRSSQQQAVIAALRALDLARQTVLVDSVDTDAPAQRKLRANDTIVEVDGTSVTTAEQVRAAVTRHASGDAISFTILRDGKQQAVVVSTAGSPEKLEQARVGIALRDEYTYPLEVDIQVDNIGGPSAGLLFALAIYDTLTPGNLTGGQNIAGTGTIDVNGNIGAVGGVQMKVIAAGQAGAEVFLTPKDNCADALATKPDGLRLVKVTTLQEALNTLEALRTGRGDLPQCSGEDGSSGSILREHLSQPRREAQ